MRSEDATGGMNIGLITYLTWKQRVMCIFNLKIIPTQLHDHNESEMHPCAKCVSYFARSISPKSLQFFAFVFCLMNWRQMDPDIVIIIYIVYKSLNENCTVDCSWLSEFIFGSRSLVKTWTVVKSAYVYYGTMWNNVELEKVCLQHSFNDFLVTKICWLVYTDNKFITT